MLIRHLDVEQGDAALIVSPSGEVAMIDSGGTGCSNVVGYVQAQGVTHIDYHFATHYHADHIGCLDDLVAAGITLGTCYDRGGSKDTQTFQDYAAACEGKRITAFKGQLVELSGGTEIRVVDLNGAGVSTSDENALGLVLKVSYGDFDHEFAGDLPGQSPDIESVVGPEVGDVEVCKVHHHGSKFSSNEAWLNATRPEVCILSVGSNSFGHPTAEAIGRLHDQGVELYWTNAGSGTVPGAGDTVCDGAVVVTVSLAAWDVSC